MLDSTNSNPPNSPFDQYDAFVESAQKWLGTRADRYHWYYNLSRISLIVMSVSLPAFSAGLFSARSKEATPFVALAIAIVASLDGLLNPGDNWRHFLSYQLALARHMRLSMSKRAALAQEEDPDSKRRKQHDLHQQFVLEVEAILEEESKKFFEHQIQQLKEPSDAA